MRILKEGDAGRAICQECEESVPIRYEYRTVHLEESGVDVENVLVGVCEECGSTISVPAQSTPKLKRARQKKEEKVEARVPRHLVDLLFRVADEVGNVRPDFQSSLLRYYLNEVANSEATARRIGALALSDYAQGRKDARISLRVHEDVWRQALEQARKVGIESQTDLIEGAILAAGEDVLDGRAKRRRRELEKIAVAT